MGRTPQTAVIVVLAAVLVVGGGLAAWGLIAQQREIDELRAERDELADEVATLEERLAAAEEPDDPVAFDELVKELLDGAGVRDGVVERGEGLLDELVNDPRAQQLLEDGEARFEELLEEGDALYDGLFGDSSDDGS